MTEIKRRSLLAGLAALPAAACTELAETGPAGDLFDVAEDWHRKAQRALANRQALAPEYAPDQRSPDIRGNGSITVDTPAYRASREAGFADWRLAVGGLVDTPLTLSLDEIKSLPQRTQITRHDCVEGWSAIAQWTGPQLSDLL
ncbi:MAG: molybdopterin-dependent oxidoreductase, partial [Erythrobacter sp.]|nr:molybdopterin-dependent oxidoreductase [Erythrobacter sp.]